jgi:cell division protein FtsI (penicillin-binding protein 3)
MVRSLLSWFQSRLARRDASDQAAADRAVRRSSSRPALTLLDLSEAPEPETDPAWRATIRQRVGIVLAFVGLWTVAIQARLVYLQVVRHEHYLAKAERQQQGVVPLPGTRGDIVDRHGNILAYSVASEGLVAHPVMIDDPDGTAAKVCAALGDCTAAERRRLVEKLSTDDQYTVVRRPRAVMPDQVARVIALGLPGVRAQAESRRWYPNRELAAHVLGFVGQDDRGLGGIESAFDDEIRGREGVLIVQKDGGQQFMAARVEQAPTAGVTLEMTIDLALQHIAERELVAGVERFRARGGTVIIMDPYTGDVLANANYPTFNPNDFSAFPPDFRKNRSVQDIYEPGSTFKIVTASAALEERIVRPSEVIETSPGYISIPGRSRPIRDDHFYGTLTFEDVIVKSSNVGAVKVGLRVGGDRMGRFLRRFGLGESLEPNLPGQSRGIVYRSLDTSSLASVSMGYQIGVTALQMASVTSVVANGGVLMEPHVVRAIVRDGVREAVEPRELRRVIRPETAATVRTFMEGVVERGTAKAAKLDRYQVAGKTGTAKKAIPGGYSDTEYNASFVAFVPSRRPLYTIVVVIDTPRAGSYYGGAVAAPIFKQIAERALQYAGASPTIHPTPPVVMAANRSRPPVERPRVVPERPVLMPVGGPALMPDVRGFSAREAVRVLGALGLTTRLVGVGVVGGQFPQPGEPIPQGGTSVLRLDRRPPAAPTEAGVDR